MLLYTLVIMGKLSLWVPVQDRKQSALEIVEYLPMPKKQNVQQWGRLGCTIGGAPRGGNWELNKPTRNE